VASAIARREFDRPLHLGLALRGRHLRHPEPLARVRWKVSAGRNPALHVVAVLSLVGEAERVVHEQVFAVRGLAVRDQLLRHGARVVDERSHCGARRGDSCLDRPVLARDRHAAGAGEDGLW